MALLARKKDAIVSKSSANSICTWVGCDWFVRFANRYNIIQNGLVGCRAIIFSPFVCVCVHMHMYECVSVCVWYWSFLLFKAYQIYVKACWGSLALPANEGRTEGLSRKNVDSIIAYIFDFSVFVAIISIMLSHGMNQHRQENVCHLV